VHYSHHIVTWGIVTISLLIEKASAIRWHRKIKNNSKCR